jgi:hypothetical protein
MSRTVFTPFTPVPPDETTTRPRAMPPWFAERGGTLDRLGVVDRIWASVPSGLTTRQLTALRGTVFVLLKPDSLAAEKDRPILDRLRVAGGHLLHVATTDGAGEGAFEELYKFDLTARNETNMLGAWWLNQRIYDSGPSLIALVYFTPDRRGQAGAHDLVSRLKGPADPRHTLPGQVRHDLAHTAPGLNLLHSSDDPLSTVREFLLFQRFDTLRAALERAADPKRPRGLAYSRADATVASLGYPRTDLDFVRTLVRLRLRTLALPAGSGSRAALDECTRRWRSLLDHDGDFTTRWSAYRLLCERDAATGELAKGHPTPPDPLAFPETYGYDTARQLWARLDAMRIQVSTWERLVVDTSMYYSRHLPR